MTATAGSAARTRPTTGFWPVLLCWLAVALDGYDLVVLGAVIPTLDSTGALGFTTASLTTAATLGLVGVGIGAITVGPVTDRIGRRKTLVVLHRVLLGAHPGDRLRPERHGVHRAALPRRARAGRLPADRADVHERVRRRPARRARR